MKRLEDEKKYLMLHSKNKKQIEEFINKNKYDIINKKNEIFKDRNKLKAFLLKKLKEFEVVLN